MSDNVSVLVPDDSGLLAIGRQVRTVFGGRIDLLCINGDGDLVIVEPKCDKTPREITAQALDYASWVQGGKMRMK
jgi:RecB family endonuclease NucS